MSASRQPEPGARPDATSIRPFDAVIFDMDGVVTRTANLHAAAWKYLFDSLFQELREEGGEEYEPFDETTDYRAYVDGKPRYAGLRSFLAARGIKLPEGDPGDPPSTRTVYGVGKRKDMLFEKQLHASGVEVFPSTIRLVKSLRQHHIKTGVVTSSRHGREVLASAGIADLFDARLDGQDTHELALEGKPNPATFVECARRLGVAPSRAIIVEDAIAGVAAGHLGHFGLTVGVDRGGNADALSAHGADVVVTDLDQLDLAALNRAFDARQEKLAWHIEQVGFDPARERDLESIFAIGNGYMGVRGAPDIPLPGSEGDLFVAGIYASKLPSRPYSEHEFLTEERFSPYAELVSMPFPFRLLVTVNGEQLGFSGNRWHTHRRELSLQEGILRTDTSFTFGKGRLTSMETRRWVSLVDLHLALQEITLCAENHSEQCALETSLQNAELHTEHPHLIPLLVEQRDGIELQQFRTRGSNFEVCIATRTLMAGNEQAQVRWHVPAPIGEPLTFRRFVAIYTSRDVEDPLNTCLQHLRGLTWRDFDAARDAHCEEWRDIWRTATVSVIGSAATSQALRFHAYHLISAADRDPRVSVGGRALTGRAYEGHIFWDVEVFMLPFYLHTRPQVARNLLRYRYTTLEGARQRARELGYRGACYAWESTVSGEDVTPSKIILKTTGKEIPIFTGTQQIHVTAGVAHGVWSYWEATRDAEFMCRAGVEILAETARFWTSRCTAVNERPAPDSGDAAGIRYHIRGVVGPDEYHHSVDDNAYTNWMAYFNLSNALEAVNWLQRSHPKRWAALAEDIMLNTAELKEWETVARNLFRPAPGPDGVIEQFAGFFELEDYPLAHEERFKTPVNRLFDWNRINGLKLVKQADVLMLLHLFPDLFSRKVLAANYRYYEPMTDHGSSLSPAIHASLAARLGWHKQAQHYWRQSLWLDLSNTMHNSTLGIHPAAMGGTWQALVSGLLGIEFTEQGPQSDPDAASRLPDQWHAVSMKLLWRGRDYAVEVKR